MVRIEKQYVFERPGGRADLSGLFQGRRRLVVYQFPFDPAWDGDCGSSSHLADRLAGGIVHLLARDTSFAAVSAAPIERIESCKERLGWTFPWLSSLPSTFHEDFPEGLSVFVRDGADVFHAYSTFERRLDALLGTYDAGVTPFPRHDRLPPQQARR
jgi:predicted dithiol-disulfide oxidoreductase (DUF899 family)